MDLAQFLAPFDPKRFVADYWDQQPLQIVSSDVGSRRADLLGWDALGQMLACSPHWTDRHLKLVMDSRPVEPVHYMVTRETADGARSIADPALVEAMVRIGATLVADGLEDISSDLRAACTMLGACFAAKAGVNVYCSTRGTRAFASHCDPHEVFAVQTAGEKRWRVYRNREDRPTAATMRSDQAAIDAAKGEVLLEVVQRPGDLLYIPRGFYHDAMASSDRSLHLTFGVQPLNGLALFPLLAELAVEDGAFRGYLPVAEAGDDQLRRHLADLGDRFAALARSPAALEDVRVRQRTLAPPSCRHALDEAAPIEMLVRTDRAALLEQPLSGSVLKLDGRQIPVGLLSDMVRWVLAQRAFTRDQVMARFGHHPAEELKAMLDQLRSAGILARAN